MNQKVKKVLKIALYIFLIALVIVALIRLPILLDKFIFSNIAASEVTEDGWAGFLGGYIGGIIGGIVTLIAMVVPLRQTQKQIDKAEKKNKLEEKQKFTNEIATSVMQYIGDVQVYRDIKKSLDGPNCKLFEEKRKYDNLLDIWKKCRKERYFNGIRTYYQALFDEKISTEYAERFFRQCDASSEEVLYDEYEKDLENKMAELDSRIQKIKEQIDEARQKYITGNNTYLLLELKLKNLPCGKALWEALSDVHEEELGQIEAFKRLFPQISFEEKLDTIKQELKVFIDKYLQEE